MIDLNYQISGIEKIEFGENLIKNIESLLCKQSILIISDQNTCSFIPKYCYSNKKIKFVTLYKPTPCEKLIFELVTYTREINLIVGIGSGTIMDICKLLAYITNKDYIIFPTAPSVNAYTSQNASIFDLNGIKVSKQAKMPKAIYVDTKIISNSPKRLILSGLYDLICSATVKLDCFLSHILTGTYYNSLFFDYINEYERELMLYCKYLTKNDTSLISLLMEALIISGFGMFSYGNSRSASQSEHIIAHGLENLFLSKFYHGEYVATGFLISSKIQEFLFKKNFHFKLNRGKNIKQYISFKKDINFIIDEKKWLYIISENQDCLYNLTLNHGYIRDLIINSNIILPKVSNLYEFIDEFKSKDKFTCLDLLYLCNYSNDYSCDYSRIMSDL